MHASHQSYSSHRPTVGALFTFAALVFAVAVLRPANVYASGADTGMITHPDPAFARQAGQWFRAARGGRAGRGMALVVMANTQCIGCSGAAVTALGNTLRREGIPTDLALVVICDLRGEGRAAARGIGAPTVVEQIGPPEFPGIHDESAPGATVIVMSASGQPVFVSHDLTHGLDRVVQVCRGLAPETARGQGVTVTRIRPMPGHTVAGMASVTYDPGRRAFAFIDPTTNSLGWCTLATPAFVGITDSFPDLDRRFKPTDDSLNIWERIIANYPRFSGLLNIVHASGDTVLCLARLFTGFSRVPNGQGGTRFQLAAGTALCRSLRGRFDSVRLLPDRQLDFRAPGARLGADRFAAPVIWTAHIEDSARAERSPDSSLAVAVVTNGDVDRRASLSFATVGRLAGRRPEWMYVRHIAPMAQDGYYYVDPGNRAALVCSLRGDTLSAFSLERRGFLNMIIHRADDAETSWDVEGVLGGDRCTVLMSDMSGKTVNALAIAQYDAAGRFLRQVEWRDRALQRLGDVYELSPIVADERYVYAAAKSSKGGWAILRLAFQ